MAVGYDCRRSNPRSFNTVHCRLAATQKHIAHLQNVLQDPIILTKRSLVHEFMELPGLAIHTIEDLADTVTDQICNDGHEKSPQDIAALMLTSGSTGNAKAVALRHGQIITAIRGKSAYHRTTTNDVFLNWIGMDHVANLTEVHLHAMGLAADQVHVPASDLIANPLTFIRLLGRHSVAYTFAPNFFLAGLVKSLDNLQKKGRSELPNLSSLHALISGGEANSTATCLALTRQLQDLGAPIYFIRPGFGMTETCAGSIYGLECPVSDIRYGREFTSLGHCIPGIEMRVTTPKEYAVSMRLVPWRSEDSWFSMNTTTTQRRQNLLSRLMAGLSLVIWRTWMMDDI